MHASYLQLGHIHIPIYGIFAAFGLMAALTLSQRTARYAGLLSEAVWNAGVAAIVSAFVISRLLLVAFNFSSFLRYPLLILALPSLTTVGIVLTAFFMLGYLRWRSLPLLPFLDAIAPCAALLWIFLSLGLYFEGTRDGMPSHWPSSAETASRPQPVELLTALAAVFLFFLLLSTLKKRHSRPQASAGGVTAIGLVVSGLIVFIIDCFRLPSELFDGSPLEGAQIIGIAMIFLGAALFLRAQTSVKRESGTEPPHAI